MTRRDQTSTPTFTLPPGRYFIGDPCYILDDEWDDACSLFIKDEVLEGKFALADGREFAIFNTMYGDGVYKDGEGTEYCVDSGSLGCVQLRDGEEPRAGLGTVINVNLPLVVERQGSIIHLGDIAIETDDWDDPHHDEYNEDDSDDEDQ